MVAGVLPPVHHNPAILTVLILTYAGIALGRIPGLKVNRTGIALLGAIAMMIFGGVTTAEAVGYVNWSTVFLLFGFFVISAQLRLSGFYHLVAGAISERLGHPVQFLLILMVMTAGLSAFLNNDIVCFVFTPIVGAALLARRINPVPFLIGLAIASNVGAAGTLIGNAQNMMIGQVAHLNFGRYLLWSVVPVAFALGCSFGIIWLLSLRRGQAPGTSVTTNVEAASEPFNLLHTIKGIAILVIVVGLFFSPLPKEIIALAAAGIHLASTKFRTEDLLGLIDWSVLILFVGLFVITGSFQSTGYGDQAVQWLAHGGFNLNTPPALIATTAFLSNLINNSAAVMLLVKVVNLSHPTTAYLLALANSFGGSLLLIGSVANLIVVQQAREMKITIGFGDFAKLGIPATLLALGGLLLWTVLI
jgi:Na+/H+ antiporter NhaD/arsenite permease-like protein